MKGLTASISRGGSCSLSLIMLSVEVMVTALSIKVPSKSKINVRRVSGDVTTGESGVCSSYERGRSLCLAYRP